MRAVALCPASTNVNEFPNAVFVLPPSHNRIISSSAFDHHQGRKPGTKCGADVLCRGSGGQKSPSGVQGRSSGRGSGRRSPPEAEAILDFYMHNFDLILNYFRFARATEIRHFI